MHNARLRDAAWDTRGTPNPTSTLLLARLVAALTVTLLVVTGIAGCSQPGPQGNGSTGRPTAVGTPSPSASPGSSGSPTSTPSNAPFVCANATGSTGTYVFVNADHQLYRVTGCAAPAQLTHLDATMGVTPLAFSPSNQHLMVSVGGRNGSDKPDCQNVMNPRTGALTPTRYCLPPWDQTWTEYPAFVGWLDDNTFVEALTQPDLAVKVVRVNATTLAATPITTLGWVADLATAGNESGIRVRGDSLFYGGYMSTGEGGAWLHRYSLSTGVDTKLVPLGVAGTGGCQAGNSPCSWTGPWDVSPDGAHIVYHKPGPTESLSDTSTEQGTPLYFANLDGSSATPVLGDATNGYGFNLPLFSPDGASLATTRTRTDVVQTAPGGALIGVPSEHHVVGWRSDGKALYVDGPQDANYNPQYAIFTIATRQLTILPTASYAYVWGA